MELGEIEANPNGGAKAQQPRRSNQPISDGNDAQFGEMDLTLQERIISFVKGNWIAISLCSGLPTLLAILKHTCCGEYFSVLDGWQAMVAIFLVLVALVLMVHGNPPDLVMVAANVFLIITKIIKPKDSISGFDSSSILAIGVLFVVAKALEDVGTIEALIPLFLGTPKTTTGAIVRLSIPVAVISSFMNNTPVVAMLIPVLSKWSKETGIPVSKLLIPLSFSSMLGGCCTLIGTSTNLVLADLAACSTSKTSDDDCGDDGEDGSADDDADVCYSINMFTMSAMGVPMMLFGVFLMAAMHKLLPDRSESTVAIEEQDDGSARESVESFTPRHYEADFVVTTELEGTSVSLEGLGSITGSELKLIWRGDEAMYQSSTTSIADEPLKVGDILRFGCNADAIAVLRHRRGLRLDCQDELQAYLGPVGRHRKMFEAMIDDSSPLIGLVFPFQFDRVSGTDDPPMGTSLAVEHYGAYVIAHRQLSRHRPFRRPSIFGASRQSEIRSSFATSIDTVSSDGGRVRMPRDRQLSYSRDRGSTINPIAASGTEVNNEISGDGLGPPVAVRRIRTGDTIVLEATYKFESSPGGHGHFGVVRKLDDDASSSKPKGPNDKFLMYSAGVVLLIMVVVTAAEGEEMSKHYTIFTTSLAASMILLCIGCLTVERAFSAIKGRVILAIVATYGPGIALEKTGVAALLANVLVAIGTKIGPIGLLSMLFLGVSLLSCVVSNQATVILLWPVIQKIDQTKVDGINTAQYAITLMMGASAAFITPIGYQTNLMVYGPGNYEFLDFVKFGGIMVVLLTPFVGVLVYYLYADGVLVDDD